MSRSRIPQAVVEHPVQRAETLAEFDAQLYAEVDTGGPRAFENDFWTSRAPSQYLDQVVRNGIPALIVSGWHDVYQRGSVLDFTGLQNAYSRLHGGPGLPASDSPPMTAAQRPTPRYQAVLGPWFHNPTTLGLTFQQLQLAWFDRWLKGIHDGIDDTDDAAAHLRTARQPVDRRGALAAPAAPTAALYSASARAPGR